MYIVVICFPAEDAINFELNLIFLIKLLEFKYLKNEKDFQMPETVSDPGVGF